MNTNVVVNLMQPPAKPRKRSVWKKMLLGLAAIAAVLIAYQFWTTYRYEKQLESLIKQITGDDPHWHWDALLEQRSALKAKDNAANEVIELLKLTTLRETIPLASRNEWGKAYSQLYVKDSFQWYEQFLEMHPNARLPEPMKEKMQPLMEMAPMAEVMQRARDLRRYQDGRFDHLFKPMLIMSLLPDVQGTRNIGNLLAWDSDLLVLRKKYGEAVESIQGMLGVSRSFTSDPFLISQLVRIALINQACRQTMRFLALPVPWTQAQLATLQNDFAREDEQTRNILEIMIRSDRAVLDHDLQALIDGKITYTETYRTFGRRVAWSTGVTRVDEILHHLFPELVLGWGNRPGHLKKERYDLLQFFTAAVHWTRLPEHELLGRLNSWKETDPCLTPFLRQFFMFSTMYGVETSTLPEVSQLRRMARGYLANRAKLRCIAVLLACERYRLEKGNWPASLEALMPQFLSQIPLDPYTGKSLILRILKEGVVIYAVGEDGIDNGGDVLETMNSQPKDVGYRLWNVSDRGINLDSLCAEYVNSKKEE